MDCSVNGTPAMTQCAVLGLGVCGSPLLLTGHGPVSAACLVWTSLFLADNSRDQKLRSSIPDKGF